MERRRGRQKERGVLWSRSGLCNANSPQGCQARIFAEVPRLSAGAVDQAARRRWIRTSSEMLTTAVALSLMA